MLMQDDNSSDESSEVHESWPEVGSTWFRVNKDGSEEEVIVRESMKDVILYSSFEEEEWYNYSIITRLIWDQDFHFYQDPDGEM